MKRGGKAERNFEEICMMEKKGQGKGDGLRMPLSDEASRKMTTWFEEKEVAR